MNAEQIDALIDYVRAAVRLALAEPLQKDAMTSLPSLLPCPFCRGPAELDTRQSYSALGTGRMGTRIAVYCLECSADIGICREDVPDVEPEHVIEQWNRRAALSTSTGQAEPTAESVLTEIRTILNGTDWPIGISTVDAVRRLVAASPQAEPTADAKDASRDAALDEAYTAVLMLGKGNKATRFDCCTAIRKLKSSDAALSKGDSK